MLTILLFKKNRSIYLSFISRFPKCSLKKNNVRLVFVLINFSFFSHPLKNLSRFIHLCSRYQRALWIYGCSQAKGHCIVLLMHAVLLEVTLSVSALSGSSLRVTDRLIQEIDFIRAENDILSACLKAKRDVWTHTHTRSLHTLHYSSGIILVYKCNNDLHLESQH